jgi:hypothetical protein
VFFSLSLQEQMSVTQLETCNTPPPSHSLSPSELQHCYFYFCLSPIALSLLTLFLHFLIFQFCFVLLRYCVGFKGLTAVTIYSICYENEVAS